MGQCACGGGASQPPSSLTLCWAFDRQQRSSSRRASSTGSEGADGTDLRRIWGFLAEHEVRAIGDIVEAWSQGRVSGTTARMQLQVRVLRGLPQAAFRLMSGAPGGGSDGAAPSVAAGTQGPAQPQTENADAPSNGPAHGRGAVFERFANLTSQRSDDEQQALGALAGGWLGPLAALVSGARTNTHAHELFATIDGVFLSMALEDAHDLAMRELEVDGPRPVSQDIAASFQRKANDILSATSQQQAAHMVWLSLVRLCLCVEVLRHLHESIVNGRASRRPVQHVAHGDSLRLVRDGSAMFILTSSTVAAPSSGLRGRSSSGRPAEPGLSFFLIPGETPVDLRAHPGQGGMTPFVSTVRLDHDFLRYRVSALLQAALASSAESMSQRPVGLTAAELERTCPTSTCRSSTDAGSCPICLSAIGEGEELRTLPCGHSFHKECCDMWLTTSGTCPTCRYQISERRPC